MNYYWNTLIINILIFATLSNAENNIASVESKQAFDQLLLNASQPLVILFHSGCPVCQVTKGYFTNMISKYPTTILYGEVNVNKLHELAQTYEITSLPTILIFQEGTIKPIYKLVGPSEEELNTKIKETLKLKKATNEK